MKVILINGSPHADGSTNRALVEVARELNKEG
ncbi:MAG: flavodoxin family protein, partial [Erysipelotrichaceae bacterium]|nr:flavodoxin family protein [Erysipelotrichaceae bacterium]